MLASTLLTMAGFVSFSTAGYVLQDDYNSNSFFDMFDFFTGGDPTHGYVTYVDQRTAQDEGLIGQRSGARYIGVDHTNAASGSGRNSVRLSSKKAYTHGLIVIDLEHMPGGQCGTWPAFWTLGPSWPNSGEIDIIEGVNSQATNDMTLHSNPGCTISNTGAFSGQMTTPNCDIHAPGQFANAGCQISSHDTASYGTGFNANGGGVYATEWTGDAISIWFFPRGVIPGDVSSGNPNPSGWGKPVAKFEGGCDIDQHFREHNIIFDITFCGDWAGNVWGQDSVCSSKSTSCQAFVQDNPGAFTDAYWQVNSLTVYQSNGEAINRMTPNESAGISVVASSQAVSSAVPLSTETSSTTSAAVASSALASSPAPTSTPAPTPAPTTLATSTQKPKYKTVSALQWNHLGSSSPGQPAGSKEKRSTHARHLLKKQHKAHP